ncbi:hypothetical protein HanRHA438_Chr09g0387051 [Helianthus annuus]|nr:hypothetical protein HanRHA438_Chr09g0387051 [Helianthus annuus]
MVSKNYVRNFFNLLPFHLFLKYCLSSFGSIYYLRTSAHWFICSCRDPIIISSLIAVQSSFQDSRTRWAVIYNTMYLAIRSVFDER